MLKFRIVGHSRVKCSSALKNSELDPSLMTGELQSDGLRTRASRPKSSKLDVPLSWLETTEGSRPDTSGVGECCGWM